jgi:hypothetical protein
VELRPELSAPPVDPVRVTALAAEVERIAELLAAGGAADDAIGAFNASTGHRYGRDEFLHFWDADGVEDLAREAARPMPVRVADVSREELAELVRRIRTASEDASYYLSVLRANVTHPRVGDLLFWPPAALVDASDAELVDAMLAYRPIAL